MLHLKLLGGLSLHDSAGALSPEALQRRRLALLALLALGDKRGIPRDLLQCYLWPESPAARGRHALDQLIYATRRSLRIDPIAMQGRELHLDPAAITTDLHEFGTAVQERRFADATRIYSGPLLQGFHISASRELEAWIDTERARLQSVYQSALESLARTASTEQDHASAVKWGVQLAASDPLSSRLAAGAIRAYTSAGDNAAAIQHARAHQKLVREDLEIEPDPSIEKLVAELPRAKVAKPRAEGDGISEATLDATPEPGQPGEMAATTYAPQPASFRRARLVSFAALSLGVAVIAGVYQQKHATPDSTAAHSASPLDPAAQEIYLRGVNFWNDRSKSSLDSAVIYFRKAVERQPDFASAHAGLADAYVMIGYSGYRTADAMFPKAKAAALRAIDLDSTLAAPYAALGMELTWERKFAEADTIFKKALRLDPSYATAHQWYGILLMIVGRTSDAVAETGKAAELDPLSLQIQNNYASFLSGSGQNEAALRHYQKVVGDEPDSAWIRRNPWLLTNMAATYAANGLYDKALIYAKRAVEILPGHPRAVAALANVYYRMGDKEEAKRVFATADTANEHYPAYRALRYVTEGQPDSAFLWFGRVHEWGIPILIAMPGLRRSKVVGDDPRLHELFDRIGLPFNPLTEEAGRGR